MHVKVLLLAACNVVVLFASSKWLLPDLEKDCFTDTKSYEMEGSFTVQSHIEQDCYGRLCLVIL